MSLESIMARFRRKIRVSGAEEPMTEEETLRKAVVDFGIDEITRGSGWPDDWVRGAIKASDKFVALRVITNHIYGFALRKGFKEKDLAGLAEETLAEVRKRVAARIAPRGKRKEP